MSFNRSTSFNLWLRSGLLAVVMLAVCQAVVLACPNCKDSLANDPAQAGLVRGFFWSILFMISMPFLILGGVGGYFYWEVCRARRAQAPRSPFRSEGEFDSANIVSSATAERLEAEPVCVS